MASFRIATAALVTLLSAAPALADGEPRTVENLFPGWTSEATGLPSDGLTATEAWARRDRHETADQLAEAPEMSPRASSSAEDDAMGAYSRN